MKKRLNAYNYVYYKIDNFYILFLKMQNEI